MASRPAKIAHLVAAGRLLYGERWQSEVGRALGVSDRTVRRWLAEERLPDDVAVQLMRLIDRRVEALVRLRRRLTG